jgi:polysaccharide biosynthesis/export protein
MVHVLSPFDFYLKQNIMKQIPLMLIATLIIASGCTSQKKLAYLNNLPKSGEEQTFTMEIPNYRLQPRDILYITAKAMAPDGNVSEYLMTGSSSTGSQDISGGYLSGYVVDQEGNILIPTVGTIKVGGYTLEETRKILQDSVGKVFKNSIVDCKLQSFKVTIIGEVKNPGTIINYTNYLTVLEAIGKAGGIGDYGDRHNILVIRPIDKETKTFTLNLQDKNILSSKAYYLFPNDVVIVQPQTQKVFNMNTPTISFILSMLSSTISTTLLLIFFFQK